MLKNEYLVAKIGFDTEENEPFIKFDHFRYPHRTLLHRIFQLRPPLGEWLPDLKDDLGPSFNARSVGCLLYTSDAADE